MLEDLVKRGGVAAMERRAIKHSNTLYSIIDASRGFYSNHVESAFRSRMNVRSTSSRSQVTDSNLRRCRSA